MTDSVSRYYDANTKGFLSRGQGGRAGVMHRAVWGPGVTSRDEAFHFVHELILREIEACHAKRVLDLGCGVGASLQYITERSGATGCGITVSPLQAELAPKHLDVMLGSFETVTLPDVDLAYAIESVVHASNAGALLENVSRALRPNGRLVICDDFVVGAGVEREPWLRRFVEGWHAPSLSAPEELDRIAKENGLTCLSDRDLTEHLEIDRPRDYVIRVITVFGRLFGVRGPRFDSLSGGDALRQCLKRGWVTYRFRVYVRD